MTPPGSWRLSFDASTRQRVGAGYSEWAFVVETAGGVMLASGHGPAISAPLSNCVAEWEGLAAGLRFLASGKVAGAKGVRIEGDEAVVIRQLHDLAVCRLPNIGWRNESLDSLATLGLPWSAAKVGRGENHAADSVAGGNW